MRNRFVFIDESGVIGGVSQPLFVLGALKIADTAALTHGLTRVRSRVCGRHGTAAPRFEFRFSVRIPVTLDTDSTASRSLIPGRRSPSERSDAGFVLS